jgi:hypothetical protein
LRESFSARAGQHLWTVLNKHARHCEAIYRDLQKGAYVDGVAQMARERLQEDLARDAQELIQQIGKADSEPDPDLQTVDADADEELKHDDFVAKLESTFGISVHHWEPIREGVIVFLDEESTGKLLGQLRSYNDHLTKLTADLGYILIRRGMQNDIRFGNFPRPLSRWVFVHAPSSIETWTKPDALAKLMTDVEKEADALDADLTKGAAKLPLKISTNKADLASSEPPLASIVAKWDRA